MAFLPFQTLTSTRQTRARSFNHAVCAVSKATSAYPRGKAVEAKRVFVGDADIKVVGSTIRLSEEEVAHLRISRVRSGTNLTLLNSNGDAAKATLDSTRTQVTIVDTASATRRASISIAICSPRAPARADWAVEKLTEIGCTSIIMVGGAARQQFVDTQARISRWRRIAVSAAKQSLAPCITKVDALTGSLDEALSTDYSVVLLCSSVGEPIITAATRLNLENPLVLVGPEGGLTQDEEKRLIELGAVPVSLGPTRLRVETAAVVAISTLSAVRLLHSRQEAEQVR